MNRAWGRTPVDESKQEKLYDLRQEWKNIKNQYDSFLPGFQVAVNALVGKEAKVGVAGLPRSRFATALLIRYALWMWCRKRMNRCRLGKTRAPSPYKVSSSSCNGLVPYGRCWHGSSLTPFLSVCIPTFPVPLECTCCKFSVPDVNIL